MLYESFREIFVFRKFSGNFLEDTVGGVNLQVGLNFLNFFCNVRNVFVQDCPSLEADRAECQKLQTAKKNVEVLSIWQLHFLKGEWHFTHFILWLTQMCSF